MSKQTDFNLALRGDVYTIRVNGIVVELGPDLMRAQEMKNAAMKKWQRRVKPTALYCLIGHPGYVKIGITRDMARRLSMLQVGNPHPLRIAGVRWYKDRCEALAAETTLVQAMARHRAPRSREWFRRVSKVCKEIRETISLDVALTCESAEKLNG